MKTTRSFLMQKSIRSIALVLAVLAIPAMSFAREPFGCNPRPQATTSSTLNNIAIALSVVAGK